MSPFQAHEDIFVDAVPERKKIKNRNTALAEIKKKIKEKAKEAPFGNIGIEASSNGERARVVLVGKGGRGEACHW